MSNSDRLATIELYRNEDGTIQMQHIHWIGKPWDGFWQYNAISEEDLNKILGMLKPPEVPESCAECEYRFSLFIPNESFCCRLVKGKIKTFSGEEDPENGLSPAEAQAREITGDEAPGNLYWSIGSDRWYVTSGTSSTGLFYGQGAALTAEAKKQLYR